jgi:hypothetical protein
VQEVVNGNSFGQELWHGHNCEALLWLLEVLSKDL